MAHELKNPLTSIRSAIETLESVKENPELTGKLRGVIAQDVKRLDRLITDISNASRLEAEMTRVPNEQIDIARFVRDVVSTYDSLAIDEGAVTVSFHDATMGGRLLVQGREGPLGQVIRNLIDNARSFSPPGAVVEVTLDQTNDGPQTIARIKVEDTGPGVPPDKLENHLQPFLHGSPERHRLRQQFRPRPLDREANHRHPSRQGLGRKSRRRRRPLLRRPARDLRQ